MNPFWGYLERQAVKNLLDAFIEVIIKWECREQMPLLKYQYRNVYYYILIETYYVLVNIR